MSLSKRKKERNETTELQASQGYGKTFGLNMKSSKFDSLIFDLDGTLWNTPEICARAWTFALAGRGISRNVAESEVAGLMGLNAEEIRQALFPALTVDEGKSLLQDCLDQEIVFIEREPARLYPGVLDGMHRLAEDYPICLVSNCDESYMQAFLKVSGIADLVIDWECYGRTQKSKGENLLNVLDRNKLTASLYVGDTEGDRKAARFARSTFIYAAYGFGKASEFDESFSDFSVFVDWVIGQ